MNILVIGGAGYIGSHTCVELLNKGHSVVIVDNLSNSKKNIINKIEEITNKKIKFYNTDVTNTRRIDLIFSSNKIDGVIHFAGLKSVSESIKNPLKYYYNNIVSTLVLLTMCAKYKVNKFIFSSSATVYGENKIPFVETMDLLPTVNPYGETKAMSEKILIDIAESDIDFSVSLLRYFNPIGAHESGLIGEIPNGVPNNIMPYITQVAKGQLKELEIFGNDYETLDGTGVRDYIHVVDLARGHVMAIEKMDSEVEIYNLGTGRGTSVLELIETFENVNDIEVPYKIVDRRPGDIAECYADTSKAQEELGWKAKKSIRDMCRDAWNFENS